MAERTAGAPRASGRNGGRLGPRGRRGLVRAVGVVAVFLLVGDVVAVAVGPAKQQSKAVVRPATSAPRQLIAAVADGPVLTWGDGPPAEFDPTANRSTPLPAPPAAVAATLWGAWDGHDLVLAAIDDRGRLQAATWYPGAHRWRSVPAVAVPAHSSIDRMVGASSGVMLDILLAPDTAHPPSDYALTDGDRRWARLTFGVPGLLSNTAAASGDRLITGEVNDSPQSEPQTGRVEDLATGHSTTSQAPLQDLSVFDLDAVAGGGRYYQFIGAPRGANGEGSRLQSLDLATGKWNLLPPSPLPASGIEQLVWTGTELLVVEAKYLDDGPSESDLPADPEAAVWQPATGTWHTAGYPRPGTAARTVLNLLLADSNALSAPSTPASPLLLPGLTIDAQAATTRPVAAPACVAGQLTARTLSGERFGTGGEATDFIAVTNHATEPCTLAGEPVVDLRPTPTSTVSVHVDVDTDEGSYSPEVVQAEPQGTVIVAPGIIDAAYLEQRSSDYQTGQCHQVLDARTVTIHLATGAVTASPAPGEPTGPFGPRFISCDGTEDLSPWRQRVWSS